MFLKTFFSLVFALLLSTYTLANEFHDLARGQQWQELLERLRELGSAEARIYMMNERDENGYTVFDVANDNHVDRETLITIDLLLQNSTSSHEDNGNFFPEEGEYKDPDSEIKDEDEQPKEPMKKTGPITLDDATDEGMGLEKTVWGGLGGSISGAISLMFPREKTENDSIHNRGAKRLSSSAPTIGGQSNSLLIKEVELDREAALSAIKSNIEFKRGHEENHEIPPELMQHAQILISSYRREQGLVARKLYHTTSGYMLTVYMHGSNVIIVTDHISKKVKKAKRTSSSPSSTSIRSTAGLSTISNTASTITTITSSDSIREQALSRSEALHFIKKLIADLVNTSVLKDRKKILEEKKVVQKAIDALRKMYDADEETTFHIYKVPGSNKKWEVVVYCDDTGKEFTVYVNYLDLQLGEGNEGFIYVTERHPTVKDGKIRLVKKMKNDASAKQRADIEIDIASKHDFLEGAVSSDKFIYEFMSLIGIKLPKKVPAALKKEIAFLLLKVLHEDWHLKGLNHGDVKPDNILLNVRTIENLEELLTLKLCDYGMSHRACNAVKKPVIATPFFREPEAGNDVYSYRADNWAAALVILILLEPDFDLEVFERTVPFDADATHEMLASAFPNVIIHGIVDPDIERDAFIEELIKFVLWLTHIDPTQRPNLDQIGDVLKRWEELYFPKYAPPVTSEPKVRKSRGGSLSIPNFGSKILLRKNSVEPREGGQNSDRKSSNSGGRISPLRLDKRSSPTSTGKLQQSTTSVPEIFVGMPPMSQAGSVLEKVESDLNKKPKEEKPLREATRTLERKNGYNPNKHKEKK